MMFKYVATMFGVPNWMGFVITIGLLAVLFWALNGTRRHQSRDKMATGGFISLRELREFNKADGIQLSKNFSLREKFCYEHVCVIGPTGAGKTTSIFYPNLLQKNSFNKGKSSLIITDPKGLPASDCCNGKP